MKVNHKIQQAMDETGLPFTLEEGGRHIKVMLHGELVTTVSRRSTQGSGRAVKNIVAAIKRKSMTVSKPPAVHVQKVHRQSVRGIGFASCRPDLTEVSTTNDPAEVTCRNCEIRDTIERRMDMVKLSSVPTADPAAQDFCLISYTRTGQVMAYLPETLVPDKDAGYSMSARKGDGYAAFTLAPLRTNARVPKFRTADSGGRAKGMLCVVFVGANVPGADSLDFFGMSTAVATREGDTVTIHLETQDMQPAIFKGAVRRRLEAMASAPANPAPEPEKPNTGKFQGGESGNPAGRPPKVLQAARSLEDFKSAVRFINDFRETDDGRGVVLAIDPETGRLRATMEIV